MTLRDKAKSAADTALEWVEEYSGKAGEKVVELAEQVRANAPGYVDRASELAEQARTKAPAYVDRAAGLAAKAAEATAAGVDRATGGRFHDRIEEAHGKLGETWEKRSGAAPNDGGSEPSVVPPGRFDGSGLSVVADLPTTTSTSDGPEPTGEADGTVASDASSAPAGPGADEQPPA